MASYAHPLVAYYRNPGDAMRIDALKHFIELANTGSFYAAAKNSFISPQGMAKSIKTLEDELDLSLVERERRGIRLTRDGELFLKYAKRMVAEYDLFAREIADRNAEDGGANDAISVFVSYYAAQIAAVNPRYIEMLATYTTYCEEPFERLLLRAESSNGSDLVFLDLHGDTLKHVHDNPRVVFEPIIVTRAGFVWKEDSPLASETFLHREEVATMPVALCANRELLHFASWLFAETPLQDIRLETSNPRMLLEYVRQSERSIAFFDSFGFFLAQRIDSKSTEGLHFTPLSTPQALMQVGFLYPRHTRMSMRAQHTVSALKAFLDESYPDYLRQNAQLL